MMDLSDGNVQTVNIEPILLIDNLSEFEVYVGYSNKNNNQTKPNWRIKRFTNVDGIHHFGFPNGNQNFEFIWNDRFTYNYF
jgi:hypothetical protein